MIFATLGNDFRDFKRMIDLLKLLAEKLPKEEFIIQIGHSTIPKVIPKNFKIFKFISRKEFKYNLINARFVISHSGAGTLLQCVDNKIVPFVLPRRVEFKEHLNNHQLDILNEFVEQKLCFNIEHFEFNDLLEYLKNDLIILSNPEYKVENKLLSKLKESFYKLI